MFLTRTSCHKTTHANSYYDAWPGWAVSVSVLPQHSYAPPFLTDSGVSVSRSVVSDSLQLHGLQPTRLLCSWNSPVKNTAGIFLTLEPGSIEPGSPALQEDSLPSQPPGKPQIQVEPYGMTDIWPFLTYSEFSLNL